MTDAERERLRAEYIEARRAYNEAELKDAPAARARLDAAAKAFLPVAYEAYFLDPEHPL